MQSAPSVPHHDPYEAAERLLTGHYDECKVEAARHQWRRRYLAWSVGLASPVAVSLLALQHLYLEHWTYGPWLVFGELIVMIFALAVEYFGFGESHDRWIRSRLQAELLKRELFLLRARVGPYLTTSDALATASARAASICSPFANPVPMLSLQTPGNPPWRDELSTGAHVLAEGATTRAELTAHVERYLAERVDDQIGYFSNRQHSFHKHDRWTELGAKAILLATTTVVSAKLVGMLLEDSHDHRSAWMTFWLFGAFVLPVFGAGTMAFRAIFEPHRLLRSFLACRAQLEELRPTFQELLTAIRSVPDSARGSDAELQSHLLRFKRLVLEAEGILSEDFRRWWVIVDPETPRA
jgi:hypothetical protein